MSKKKSKKRRHSSSDSEKSSDSSVEKKKLRKLKKKLKKEQRKTEKYLKNKLKEQKKKGKKKSRNTDSSPEVMTEKSADIPLELMEKSKSMAPMTKEEWEKRQSVVRRIVDEETGRHRLIKGDGEVLEEIVSRDRHKAINRKATQADGDFFQAQTISKKYL